MLYRGIEVTYESIREWCQKFGQQYANQLRRKRPYISDKWHLDEVVVTIKGQQYYLWRAVDAEGNVLDVLLQRQRDTKAAYRLCTQTAEETRLRASRNCDRPTQELRSGKETSTQERRASTAQGIEQSGGELPPTNSNARTANAAIQIPRASTTISIFI